MINCFCKVQIFRESLYLWYYKPHIFHLLFLNPGGRTDGVIFDISGLRFRPVSTSEDAIDVLSSNQASAHSTHEEAAGLNVALGCTQDAWINQLARFNLVWVQSVLYYLTVMDWTALIKKLPNKQYNNMFDFLFSVSKMSRYLLSRRRPDSLSTNSSHPFFFLSWRPCSTSNVLHKAHKRVSE